VEKVDTMYHTGSLLDGRFPSETWTGQRGLFTDWDYLLRECITVLLHEKKIQLGMLNPYAEIYIPQSQRNNQSNGNKGKREEEVDDQKKIHENEPQMVQTSKPQPEVTKTLKSTKNKEKEDERKNAINNTMFNKQQWMTPTKPTKYQEREITKKRNIKHNQDTNRFAILDDYDENVDLDESPSYSSTTLYSVRDDENKESSREAEDNDYSNVKPDSWSDGRLESDSDESDDESKDDNSSELNIELNSNDCDEESDAASDDSERDTKICQNKNKDMAIDDTNHVNKSVRSEAQITREQLVHEVRLNQKEKQVYIEKITNLHREIEEAKQTNTHLQMKLKEAEDPVKNINEVNKLLESRIRQVDEDKKIFEYHIKNEREANREKIQLLENEIEILTEELEYFRYKYNYHDMSSSDEESIEEEKKEIEEEIDDSSKDSREDCQEGCIRNSDYNKSKEEIEALQKRVATLEEALRGKTKQLLDHINRDRGKY